MSDSTDPFLRRPDVERMTGLSTATIYRMIQRGEFPKGRKYRCAAGVFWLLSEIRDWQAAQLDAAA